MRIEEAIQRIGRIASPTFMESIARDVGLMGLGLIGGQFIRGVTPTGAKWAPLKRGNRTPLNKSGRLRDTFTAHPMANGVRFIAGVDYGLFHQYGTRKAIGKGMKGPRKQIIPVRQILIRTGETLPNDWKIGITASFVAQTKKRVSS